MTGRKFIEETGVWVYVLDDDIKLITSLEGVAIRQNAVAQWEIVDTDSLKYVYDAYLMEVNDDLHIDTIESKSWLKKSTTNYNYRKTYER